jgi:tRNA pseudouridine38-40 synthase
MKIAAKKFVGTYDFRSFMKTDPTKQDCIRTINKMTIKKEKEIIIITMTGTGFLRKMARNIVGLLLEISTQQKEIEIIKYLLTNPTIKVNIKNVPGCGLYLEEVKY